MIRAIMVAATLLGAPATAQQIQQCDPEDRVDTIARRLAFAVNEETALVQGVCRTHHCLIRSAFAQ